MMEAEEGMKMFDWQSVVGPSRKQFPSNSTAQSLPLTVEKSKIRSSKKVWTVDLSGEYENPS